MTTKTSTTKKTLSVFAIERRNLHAVEDEKERDHLESLIDNREAADDALKRAKLNQENERYKEKLSEKIRREEQDEMWRRQNGNYTGVDEYYECDNESDIDNYWLKEEAHQMMLDLKAEKRREKLDFFLVAREKSRAFRGAAREERHRKRDAYV